MLDLGDENSAELPDGLTLVRHLEAYDGPILSEYSGKNSAVYIEKWCEREGNVSRYLLVRSNQRSIAEFLGNKLSMLQLLKDESDGVGFVIDRQNGDINGVHVAPLSRLPRKYFPTRDRMHDEDLRPAWE